MDILSINQNIATGILGLIIIIIFVIPYLWSVKKKERITLSTLSESEKAGRNTPLMQHPQFNLSACIGCGICTQVCPEGDVLGLINGKVAIINGAHCIGIGECARQCPIGAISIGMGDISTREDIPQLNTEYESSVPGVYVIGELGGMALIRNAIDQGTQVVDTIKQRNGVKNEPDDVLIVGAGTSGLSAALRCIEKDIGFRIIDQGEPGGTILQYPRRKLTMVQKIHLPMYGDLSKLEYSKEELLDIWYDVIDKHQLPIQSNHKLLSVRKNGTGYFSETSQGDIHSKNIILALGRRGTPRKLGIPGEELSKVMYKLMDAATYQDKHILIVGGGDSAIEAAIGLSKQKGNTVTISYRKEAFFRIKKKNQERIEDKFSKKYISVLFNSNPKLIAENSVTIEQEGNQLEIENDYVFIFAGGELPFPLLNKIGIEFGRKNKVMV